MNGSIPFVEKTLIMGIINMSPDSFYTESRLITAEEAVNKARYYEEVGADIVDIGGESTRPGSKPVAIEEELKRVLPVVEGIRNSTRLLISVDTYKTEVATRVIDLGIHILNNISGLRSAASEGLEHIIAKAGVYVVLMHMRGTPLNMQKLVHYHNVTQEVSDELDISINKALHAGIDNHRIIIDPGIGFAKSAEHNLQLIKNLPFLRKKGYPILIGLSRKSFIGAYTGLEPEERLIPTVAANAISIFQGADIIRVHDVKEAVETARIVDAIMKVEQQ